MCTVQTPHEMNITSDITSAASTLTVQLEKKIDPNTQKAGEVKATKDSLSPMYECSAAFCML